MNLIIVYMSVLSIIIFVFIAYLSRKDKDYKNIMYVSLVTASFIFGLLIYYLTL